MLTDGAFLPYAGRANDGSILRSNVPVKEVGTLIPERTRDGNFILIIPVRVIGDCNFIGHDIQADPGTRLFFED